MDVTEAGLRAAVRDLCAEWNYEPMCDAWAGQADPGVQPRTRTSGATRPDLAPRL